MCVLNSEHLCLFQYLWNAPPHVNHNIGTKDPRPPTLEVWIDRAELIQLPAVRTRPPHYSHGTSHDSRSCARDWRTIGKTMATKRRLPVILSLAKCADHEYMIKHTVDTGHPASCTPCATCSWDWLYTYLCPCGRKTVRFTGVESCYCSPVAVFSAVSRQSRAVRDQSIDPPNCLPWLHRRAGWNGSGISRSL